MFRIFWSGNLRAMKGSFVVYFVSRGVP
jgi:hypothetical protein